MFKSLRRNKKQSKPVLFDQLAGQKPSLRELCDQVAAHPESVIVAVFDVNDFPMGTDYIDHEYLRDAIYDLVMKSANN